VLPYVVLLLQVRLCRARVPALRAEPLGHVDQTHSPMTDTMILVREEACRISPGLGVDAP